MKRLLFLLLLIPFLGVAQKYQHPLLFGEKKNRLLPVVLLGMPKDTLAVPDLDSVRTFPHIAFKNGNMYIWNPDSTHWIQYVGGSGGSGSLQNLQSVTNEGSKTLDTISAKALRTQRLLPDTADEPDFELVVFPDLQYQTLSYPAALSSMFGWVVDNYNNVDSANVKAVIGVGDITQNATGTEFIRADSNYDRFDALDIPYITVPGNHDYASANPVGRNLTTYDTYFGESRYTGKSWYGGCYPGSAGKGMWIKLDIGSKKFLIMGFEFLPPDSVLTWGQNVLDSVFAIENDRRVIITTHGYITSYGEIATDTSQYSTATYGLSADNDGVELWNNFIKINRQIMAVVAGHYITPFAVPYVARYTDVGIYGNVIHQFLVNYQGDLPTPNGYFMRWKFKPATDELDVSIFSRYLGGFDSRYPTYTLNASPLQVQNSTGINDGGLFVNGPARLDSTVYLKKFSTNRILYTGINGRLRTNDWLRYDSTGGLYVGNPASLDSTIWFRDFTAGRILYTGTNGKIEHSTALQYDSLTAQTTVSSISTRPTGYESNLPATLTVSSASGNYGFVSSRAAVSASPAFMNFYKTRNADATVRTRPNVSDAIGRLGWQIPNRLETGVYIPLNIDAFVMDTTGGAKLDLRISSVPSGESPSVIHWQFHYDGSLVLADNPASFNASAILDVRSTNRGFAPPRMTAAQRVAISSPIAGLNVWDNDSLRFMGYNGTTWKGIAWTGEAGGGSGVTSVATNTGTGITGGTITTTGTIAADTLTLATRAWRQKAIDSLLSIRTVPFKSVSIPSPTSSENVYLFYTDRAITVTKVAYAIRGSSTPSVSFDVHYSSNRADGSPTQLIGTDIAATTTSGTTTTSFNDATIPAGSFVWLVTSALSGTVTELGVTIIYTQD